MYKFIFFKEIVKSTRVLPVCLSEFWTLNGFSSLFVSLRGVFGTGVCVFSRYPILNTFVYPFALSGYPYALYHGDWFGGKAACFALIDHPKMKIHFFTSHVS